ncbi:hypothetical protein BIT28_27770 [Photobacterium proteolyticum]|uniref:Uncharacterized protein n=1 Tax=Photobacterium proteolyticum TaxID=1903952 RepID=A0A1Q9H7M6_9GAMM|nr:hypothetical protein [Photobacterium proteolyticum]OLQ83747.1 hypothetical protein BIT28_27770 [Photobacterium proteolyticum]
MSAQELRQDETRGSLDSRVLALEMNSNNRWETWFGRNPGIVLGSLIAAMCTGFWVYHTWQVERIDKKHQEELTRITKENDSRILWLKEQHKLTSQADKDKCDIEVSKLKSKLLSQSDLANQNITKPSS